MDKSEATSTYVENTDSSGPDGVDQAPHPHHLVINQGNEALVLDVGLAGGEKGDVGSLKLAKNGHTVLIPQPSEDPEDPLNWSWGKKHIILLIAGFSAFLGDFGSGAGVPLIVVQGVEWGLSPTHVNYAGNLNVLMLAIGGIVWIPMIYFWGRFPVLFWTTVAGAFFTLGCALTSSFNTYYFLRAMMGFTLTCGQTVGLSYIKDMFFFHEHARKIGIWASLFLLSPYAGPLLGNFILAGTGQWRPVFWMVFGGCCLDLVLIVLFCDESWYRRDIPISEQPPRGNRMMRMIGVWQIRHHKEYFFTAAHSCGRLVSVFVKRIMPLSMLYYALSFMWAVGINITSSLLFATPVAEGGYGFGTKALACLYFTPVVAVSLGEAFGHFFNDFIANRYIRRHNGVFKPEARLITNYIASFFMIPGLIIVGQALDKHLNYSAIVMGWGMYVFGVMVASVAITAYCLDAYPTGSGEVSCLLNLARTAGGFTVGYFQQQWGAKSGYDVSFGIQAAVVAFATLILLLIQTRGQWMREKSGPLKL